MIFIKNISLTNFESIDSLSLDFEDSQMTAIQGENGSGKSSLFHAIAFLLFNYKKGDSYRSYVKLGTDESTLHMEIDLDGYPAIYDVVIRAEGRSGTPVTRKVSYKGVEYGTSDYAKFIKENNIEHLEEIMFLFQGSSSIIDARPAERAAILRRLFNLDFSDYVVSLKDEQETNKISMVECSAVLKDLQGRSFEKQPLSREVPHQLVDKWEAELSEINKCLAEFDHFDMSSLTTSADLITRYEKQLADEKRKLSLRESELKAKETQKFECSSALQDCLAGRTFEEFSLEVQKNTGVEKESLEQLFAKETSLGELLKNIQTDISLTKHSLNETSKHITASSSGVCHSCGQPIDDQHLARLHKEESTLQDTLSKQLDEHTSLNADLSEVKSKIRVLQNRLSGFSDQLQRCETLTDKLANLETQLNSSRDLISSISQNVQHFEYLLHEESRKYSELQKLSEKLVQRDALLQQRSSITEKITSAKAVFAANAERRRLNEEKRREEDLCNERISSLSTDINNLQLAITTNKSCIDIFESKLPNFVILRACKDLEVFINSIVTKAFPYMTVELRSDRSGVSFFYHTTGSEEAISISMASGAQKKIVTLAYQIALATLFNTGVIFLDEIDASMSPENASIVYEFISNLTSFPQVFFISHRQESIQAVTTNNPDTVCYSVANGEYAEIS